MIRGATGAWPERFGPTDGAALVSQGDVDCGTHAVSVADGSGRLALWHRNFPGLIAGSIHEVAPTDRPALARLLSAQGLTVHVHATADDGDIAGLWTAVAATHPAPIDVHVIGSEAFVDDMLPAVLAARPGRVFLPFSTFTDRRAAVIRGADVRAWITVWDEWDDTSAPRWPADPDGVLVILTEPGTTDRCRGAQQVKVAAECAAQFPALPVMVEGSITESFAPVCAAAGVQQMVVGRSCITEHFDDGQRYGRGVLRNASRSMCTSNWVLSVAFWRRLCRLPEDGSVTTSPTRGPNPYWSRHCNPHSASFEPKHRLLVTNWPIRYPPAGAAASAE